MVEQPVDPQAEAVLFGVLRELLSDDPTGQDILTQLQQRPEVGAEELAGYLRRRLEADEAFIHALADTPELPDNLRTLVYRSQVDRIVSIAIAQAGTVQADTVQAETVILPPPERSGMSLWAGLTALTVVIVGLILGALSLVGDRIPATPTPSPMLQVEPIATFQGQIVSAIAQNPQNGDVWISTIDGGKSGVHRFTRGEGWTHFEQTGEKPRADVQAILGRANGEMWFATRGEGVTVLLAGAGTLSEDDDHWQTYTISDGLIGSKLLAITEDQRGNIWFGTYSGLCMLTPKGEWLYYHSETGWTDNLQTLPEENRPVAYAIRVDEAGDVWAATSQALLRWPATDLEHPPTYYSREGALGSEDRFGPGLLVSLAFDREGRSWVGTTGGAVSVLKEGARTLDERDDEWQTYHQIAPEVDTAIVLALLPLSDDDLILAGTAGGGLRVWAKGTDSWAGHPELGLNVLALFIEEEAKRVWIGTNRGLFLWSIQSTSQESPPKVGIGLGPKQE